MKFVMTINDKGYGFPIRFRDEDAEHSFAKASPDIKYVEISEQEFKSLLQYVNSIFLKVMDYGNVHVIFRPFIRRKYRKELDHLYEQLSNVGKQILQSR